MTDVLNIQQRKYCMSKIRGGNTTPEVLLRKALWRKGLRYRLRSSLPGRPDITFPKQKIAIFVDGCFWHKCPRHFTMPKTRTKFWTNKIDKTCERDKEVTHTLGEMGWCVVRVWEHEIKENIDACVEKIHYLMKYNELNNPSHTIK